MKRPRPTTLEPLAPALLLALAAHAVLALLLVGLWHEARHTDGGTALVWLKPADFRDPLATREGPKTPSTSRLAASAKKAPPAAPKAPAKVTAPAPGAAIVKATLVAAPPQKAMPAPVQGTPLFAGAAIQKPSANRELHLRPAEQKPKPAISAEIQPTAPPLAAATLGDMARLSRFRPGIPSLPPPPGEESPAQSPGVDLSPVTDAVYTAFLAAWTSPPLDAVPANQRSATLLTSVHRDGSLSGSQMIRPSGSHALDDSILAAVAKVTRILTPLPEAFSKPTYDLELTFSIKP